MILCTYICIYIISVCVFISITPLFASTSTCTSLDRGDAISGIQGQWQDAVEDLLLNRRQSGDVWSFEGSTQREASHPNVWSEVPYFWGWKGRKAHVTCRIIFLSAGAQSLRCGWHRRAHHTAVRWSSSIHCPHGAETAGAPAASEAFSNWIRQSIWICVGAGSTFCLKFHASKHT